jgi:RNA polymerase sigma-70 factor (family 1)
MLISKALVDDGELINLLKKGNARAFDLLYERYWKDLYIVAYDRVSDEEVAKDIVQDLLIDIWKRHESIQINESLSQFLFGAIKLRILNHYRSENIKQKVLERAQDHMHNVIVSMDELTSYYDLEKVVEEEVSAMPNNMKHSFLLRSDNRSVKEIAGDLKLAEQTVSNNISQALNRLRKRVVLEYPDRHLTCFAFLLYVVNI